MLTILQDPAGITGKHTHAWDYTQTLQDNIAAHLAGGADCELMINGVKVDPLLDARLLMPPSVFDAAIVMRRPGAPLAAVAWYWWIAAAVVAVGITYALMPKVDASASGSVGKDSPNNRLTAQSNQARAYQAVPDIYGARRVWPDMIQPSTVEYIDNIKYVTEWLCVSRGRGDISAVQYADTPILDIDGASFEVFQPAAGPNSYPEYNSTTLSDVLETFASDEVNGQELPYAVTWPAVTRAGVVDAVAGATSFTIKISDGADLDKLKSIALSGVAAVAFSWSEVSGDSTENFAFSENCPMMGFSVSGGVVTFTFSSSTWPYSKSLSPSVLAMAPSDQDTTSAGPFTLPIAGDRLRWNTVFLRGLKGTVTIRAEWWRVDDDGIEVGGTRQAQDNSYGADTFDQRFYTTSATPAGGFGRYRIQFTRLTGKIGDGGTDVAKLEEVYAVRHYLVKVLPGVTIIRVTTKATEQATGYSERKFNLRFARHIRTLTADALSPSRNFARVMAHIWTLAGNPIAELDTDALAAVNAEFGETSSLLRFDASLDDADMSLGERLQLVANHARCIVWRDGQKWTVTRDQARQYPELQFDYRNLASDGDSALSYASHLPASNDGVEVEYVDPLTQAKKTYVRLSIASGAVLAGEGANPKKIKLMGCTTLAQATNRAQLEARRLLYQRTSVSDKALSDANSLGLGSLVRWIDPNDFFGDDGLQGGEVLSIAGGTITTSEALNWNGATSGRIAFTNTQGGRLGAPISCTPAPGGVVLSSVQDGLFVADGVTRQCGSRYAFAVGLTEAEIESAGLYTVTEIKPAGDGTCSLALAAYDQRTYGYD